MRVAAAAKKNTRRKIIVALVVLAKTGGGVGAFFATQGGSSESGSVPNDTTPATEATDSPTDLTLQSPSPSGVPSLSPTTVLLKYPPPSEDDYNAVAQQLPVEGEESMRVLGFALDMEAILSQDIEPGTVLSDIEAKLKSILVPSLVGCTDLGRRQLQGNLQAYRHLVSSLRFAIANAKVTVNLSDDGVCETETAQPCYRITVTFEVSLKGEEKILGIMGIILQLFQQDDLVDFLALNEPAEFLLLMTLASTDTTDEPSASPTGIPSIPPSMAPSSNPSTSSPSDAPSSHPTRAPIAGPTTNEPTEAPVPDRTPSPTDAPLTSSPT
ncbi:unnamed protein product [Cylindrotheca closterium]|uniref:Uncharacterized protein n=1 Tax=Cylindrotheca closterium TaxID=2856 RepID=A0AAD2G7D7_9STRA|nr:unnamed protein product [Cylindrotheca closterium]